MLGFLTKLMVSGQLKFEEGRIVLLKQPMVFVPVDFFIESTKRVIANKDRKGMLNLYLDAWKSGFVFMEAVSEIYKMKKFEERYRIAMDIISMAGFGDYETLEFRRGEYSHFRIMNNRIAEHFHPSTVAVDHVLRGFNAGGGTPVHERIINTIETECKAVNGDHCIHVNATTEILEKYRDRKLVEEQLDLEYLLREQKNFLRKRGSKISD